MIAPEGLLSAMREVWARSGHNLTSQQRARMAEAVENKEY
jgi:hypothetical protein